MGLPRRCCNLGQRSFLGVLSKSGMIVWDWCFSNEKAPKSSPNPSRLVTAGGDEVSDDTGVVRLLVGVELVLDDPAGRRASSTGS